MMGTSDEHGESTSVHISSHSLSHPPHRILHKETSKKSDIPVNYTDISLPSDIRMPERPGSSIYHISFHIRSDRYQILTKRMVDRYGNYPV
ncbi:hypothetical protein M422DRAFT_34247 [Sphaerobolus stellatus SS14]|uniref:Uncharacterized protein n=1 Tax=Sphaerobolus stellatus (strain SS14) TaxID=990650 RepID=A0A0C9U124_SPHS4|nr:hypothetical protein M422DRAFT_34247 [Sphaerobolus stellatus SS14]